MRRRLLPLLLMLAAAAHSEVVDITEGTNLSLAVDPAGEFIVIDLLGGLWRLPVTGGGATPLLPAGSGAAQPRLDPNGGSVVFQRWQGGQWDIWKLTLAGGAVEPLTETAFDEREPEFSADGRQVVFAANGAGNFNLFALDLESRALTRLTDEPGDARFPSFDTDGTLVYASVSGSGSSVRRYTPGAGSEALLESARRLDAPSWRPGGGVLLVNERSEGRTSNLSLFIDADEPVWRRLTGSEDVFVGRVGWLSPEEYVYAADGALWRRGIGSQSRSRILIFAAVDVENVGAAPEAGPLDATGPHPVAGINGVIRHDATGRVAFSALGDLWLIEDDELSRLTDDPFVDAEPQFTPDGDWLVFASDRGGAMSLWRQRIDSGQRLQVTNGPGQAFSPRVSADGRFVAFLETRGNGRWDESELRLLDLSRPFESRTLARGLFDAGGLTWQGRYLRLSARDAAGGDAYPQVFETVAAELGAPAVSQPALEAVLETDEPPRWQPAAAEAPYVIQAGRLFDGIRGEYRYHVDIHIDGQRITDIVRRGLLPLPERVIDMSESTVLPGLIDVHTHLGDVGGAEVGKRWLRFGITTVREVTPDWRVSLERAETWASGRAPGPRLIVSPAMLPADADLPAGSPIVVRESRRIFGGFAHSLAEHWARVGDTPRGLSPLLPSGNPPGLPPLAISTLGQSYGDIVGQIQASGAYFATGLGALDAVSQVQGLDRLNQTFERIMRGTGRIAIGSDAPAVAYGLGFHDELKRLADRGVAPDQILRYATAGGAIALGLSLQLGTLEPGRLADLVVIDGDPLQNLAALRRVEAVVVRGVWLDIDDLDEAR